MAVPPGDVPSGTTVSIAPVTQADLPQALPDGFHYAGAFDLNLGVDGLNVPVQLGIKVDPSIAPGTKVYFFQAGDYLNNDGTTRPIWWQVENGVVGNDGYAHTSSKPFPGANANSRYLVAYGDSNIAVRPRAAGRFCRNSSKTRHSRIRVDPGLNGDLRRLERGGVAHCKVVVAARLVPLE